MTQTTLSYEALKVADGHRRRLLAICEEFADVDRQLGEHQRQQLASDDERIRSDAFRVMVVGSFRRGKSTLINALLGDKVLPSFAVPTTAVLTDVRYAEKPSVRLWRLDNEGELDPDSIEDLPVEQLADRIRIDVDNPDRRSPYGLAEVLWPIELCRNGVAIVDSPGLDEHDDRQRTTLEGLRHSDAIIVVQDILTAMSKAEAAFIEAWLYDYDLLVVFNKINLIDEDEHEEVKRNARVRFAAARGDLDRRDQLFFVNAKGALTARQEGRLEGWEQSGMAAFQDALTTYLLTQRHKAKIFGPARSLQRAGRAMQRQIPEALRMLDEEHTSLVDRYEREREPLADLERRAAQIDQGLGNAFEDLSHRVRGLVRLRVSALAGDMPQLVTQVQTETTPSLNPLTVKRTSEQFVAEVVKGAGMLAQQEFNAWLRAEFVGEVTTELTRVSQSFAGQLADYQADLDGVRHRLTGVEGDGDEVAHLLDNLVGTVDSGLDVDLDGMRSGAWMAHLMQQVMAAMGVALVWLFTPFGLGALVFASIVAALGVQGWATDKLRTKILDKVGLELERSMGKQADLAAEKARQAFLGELRPIAAAVGSELTAQLEALRAQVEEVLQLKESGEREVAARRTELEALRSRLGEATERLDELLGDVALSGG